VLVAAIYVVCYFVAGMFVFLFVRDFYTARALPSGGLVAAVQFFVRGPLFAVAIAMLVWQMPTPRAQHAVAGSLLMCVIGGWRRCSCRTRSCPTRFATRTWWRSFVRISSLAGWPGGC